MSLYRERFSETGIYENALYPGIRDLLSDLNRNSFELFVVTTKPAVYAKRIIDHYSLTAWFSGIFGTELDGRFDDKAELVAFVLSQKKLNSAETVMVGDKAVDIAAGKMNKTKTVGVTYGYGSKGEIINAAPDYFCNSPAEIRMLISNFRN